MDLPVRITDRPSLEPVISVDGAFDAPGLNLSHWPGNKTPRELRHDLSTGAALAFARLAPARRAELARGCTAIVNNHYDTDGSCALFAVRHPGLALERSEALLEAARAGDFYQLPSERGLILDAIVDGLADPERSPLAARFAGGASEERYQIATLFLLEELPSILDGNVAPYRELWEQHLAFTRSDVADLGRCARDEIAHLDWCVWTAPEGSESKGGTRAGAFDPGRHALFGSTSADRVLVVGPRGSGATYRLIFSTLSWFDLVTREAQPRPALAPLAERLNELEGGSSSGQAAWRFQNEESPSPELWFGTEELEHFSEHNGALRESRLSPGTVRRTLADAMRGSLVLPG